MRYNVKKIKRRCFLLLWSAPVAFFSACGPDGDGGFLRPPETTPNFSNHIIVASQANQSVSLLSPSGDFVRDVLVLNGTTTDTPFGVSILDATRVLVSVDGVDRITMGNIAAGPSGSADFIVNGNLSGTIGNLTRLVGGDILAIETNNVERFTSSGIRVTTGGWPLALQTGGSGIEKIPSGGFVLCSTTADRIRTYTESGAPISALIASGIGATTDASDCASSSDGRIAVGWNGTVDTIRIFTDQTLTAVACNFANAALLPNPQEMDFRPNGNLLIADGTNNILVEITPACALVGTISSSAIATPTGMKVVP